MDLDLLLKNTSRSLYLSARILPKTLRPAFAIAYLLCRYADTIADTPLLPSERRLFWIEKFPELVRTQPQEQIRQIAQEISGTAENPYEAELIKNLPLCLDAYNKIEKDLQTYILEVVQNVCAGMKIDLSTFPNCHGAEPAAFETQKQLTQYCRFMGGKPGLFWSQLITHIYRVKVAQSTFFEWGEKIGDALQIVNILRDTPKDLSFGRCYFPAQELQGQHLCAKDLLNAQNSPRFEPLKHAWIQWGKQNLEHAKKYFAAIPKTAFAMRAAVAWPVLWTADNYVKLSEEPDLLNPQKRVKIPRRVIYFTMLLTPFILLSNTLFNAWLSRKLDKIA
jgi:farnesyl-diphosphate farnesyltransferase